MSDIARAIADIKARRDELSVQLKAQHEKLKRSIVSEEEIFDAQILAVQIKGSISGLNMALDILGVLGEP